MDRLQQFLNASLPLRYDTVFSIGVREDGSVCLLGGVAAYNASGEQVALVSGFDCDHHKIVELAQRYTRLQPDPAELTALTVRRLGRRPFYRVSLCGKF